MSTAATATIFGIVMFVVGVMCGHEWASSPARTCVNKASRWVCVQHIGTDEDGDTVKTTSCSCEESK